MSAGPLSIALSAGFSAAGASAFLLVTLLTGDYGWVGRTGGTVWIFVLAMIILLPTVMPLMRSRAEKQPRDTRASQKEVAMAKDPVCGMEVDPVTAAGTSDYKGQSYYFCNLSCKKSFEEEPEKYLAGA